MTRKEEIKLEKKVEEAKDAARTMMDEYNKRKSKLNTPEFKKMKDAFDNIDFRNEETFMNTYKIIGIEIEKMFNNDSSNSK